MWSVCRQRTSCDGTSTGRIASRTACVDTGTCCAGVCGTTIDTSRAGCPIVYAASAAPQPAPTVPLPALPIPAPAAYQATDATAVLASQRKSSKKLIAAFCALLATILVAALAFIIPNFTAVKAMLGFRPTNPLVVTFDAINSLSTLRSTKYELRTHSSTDDSLDARMSGMYSLGKTTNESSASFTSKTDEYATTFAWYKGAFAGKSV